MRRKIRYAIPFLTAALLAPPAASEPPRAHDAPSTVRVDAEGAVAAAPDRVSLTVRVVTEDPRSAKAAEDNAARTRAVLSALRRAMGDDADAGRAQRHDEPPGGQQVARLQGRFEREAEPVDGGRQSEMGAVEL